MPTPSHPTPHPHRARPPLSAVTHIRDAHIHPFASVEQAWFWFMRAARARPGGAPTRGGVGYCTSSAAAADCIAMIWEIVDRLRRSRRLLRDHLLVLRHYGARAVAPRASERAEARSALLWRQAMQVLAVAFARHGLIHSKGEGGQSCTH